MKKIRARAAKTLRNLSHVYLCVPAAIACERHQFFIVREGRMRMRPLRSINGVGRHLHPTQRTFATCDRGNREILRQGVSRFCPLRALTGGFREADPSLSARIYVDEMQSYIGM